VFVACPPTTEVYRQWPYQVYKSQPVIASRVAEAATRASSQEVRLSGSGVGFVRAGSQPWVFRIQRLSGMLVVHPIFVPVMSRTFLLKQQYHAFADRSLQHHTASS
jgi:hypothetical protein